jgi:hypothetical protein
MNNKNIQDDEFSRPVQWLNLILERKRGSFLERHDRIDSSI